MPENHEKSEVISDRPTDIVNYRVACTRLKKESEKLAMMIVDHAKSKLLSFNLKKDDLGDISFRAKETFQIAEKLQQKDKMLITQPPSCRVARQMSPGK